MRPTSSTAEAAHAATPLLPHSQTTESTRSGCRPDTFTAPNLLQGDTNASSSEPICATCMIPKSTPKMSGVPSPHHVYNYREFCCESPRTFGGKSAMLPSRRMSQHFLCPPLTHCAATRRSQSPSSSCTHRRMLLVLGATIAGIVAAPFALDTSSIMTELAQEDLDCAVADIAVEFCDSPSSDLRPPMPKRRSSVSVIVHNAEDTEIQLDGNDIEEVIVRARQMRKDARQGPLKRTSLSQLAAQKRTGDVLINQNDISLLSDRNGPVQGHKKESDVVKVMRSWVQHLKHRHSKDVRRTQKLPWNPSKSDNSVFLKHVHNCPKCMRFAINAESFANVFYATQELERLQQYLQPDGRTHAEKAHLLKTIPPDLRDVIDGPFCSPRGTKRTLTPVHKGDVADLGHHANEACASTDGTTLPNTEAPPVDEMLHGLKEAVSDFKDVAAIITRGHKDADNAADKEQQEIVEMMEKLASEECIEHSASEEYDMATFGEVTKSLIEAVEKCTLIIERFEELKELVSDERTKLGIDVLVNTWSVLKKETHRSYIDNKLTWPLQPEAGFCDRVVEATLKWLDGEMEMTEEGMKEFFLSIRSSLAETTKELWGDEDANK